jgi:ATP-dependent Zn protease
MVVATLYIGYTHFTDPSSLDYSLAVNILAFIISLLWFFFIIIIFLILFLFFLQLTSQHQRSQMNHDCNFIVSESGIVNESPTKRTELNWSGITKVSQTRNSILVYLSEQSAFVISKKAFPNQSEAKAFFDYTYNLWKLSRRESENK